MYLIVGLGNPGQEYERTRHNMGFQVIDRLIRRWNITLDREAFHGLYAKTKFAGQDVIILKPMTFMNLSGQSVMELSYYYKIPVENILVIYDDVDTVPGKIRLRERGSSGGQNGIKSVMQMMHTEEIKRIRIGTGQADRPMIDYVLGIPSAEDAEKLAVAQEHAVDAVEAYLTKGFLYAKSRYC